MEKYTREQKNVRTRLKRIGYRLGDPFEPHGQRYIIFYSDETSRNEALEYWARHLGFTFSRLPKDMPKTRADYKAAWNASHKAYLRDKHIAWYAAHTKEIRQYYQDNKDRLRKYARDRYWKKKQEQNETKKE